MASRRGQAACGSESRKTRIETMLRSDSSNCSVTCGSESRKTRIETQGMAKPRQVSQRLVEVNPEKQGLKHM